MSAVPRYVAELGQPSTVPALLDARAEATPDDRFVTLAGEHRTYGEALAGAERTAGGLAAAGVRRGDRIVVMLPNCLEFLDLWFGAALLGAVLVPVNSHLRGEGLRYLVEHCGARLAVVEAALVEPYESALGQAGPRALFVRGDTVSPRWTPLGVLLDERHAATRAVVRPGDLASVLYTSGTTGLPKGVMTCHNAYVAAGLEYARNYVQLRAEDVLWTCLPLFHINAQSITAIPSLLSGCPAVMAAKFSGSGFLEEVRAHGATVFNYIGAILTILLKQPEREDDADNPLRIGVGSSAPAERWREIERRFGLQLIEIYGLTETAGVALSSTPDAVRVGSCGRPVSWAEVRIAQEDGNDAAPDEPGEFLVRSTRRDTMFQGYFENPAATAAATVDGWFHSGDRGRRSADGWFTFIDRLKDSIRRRGENISSYEVERVVNAHPDVAESAAIGVPSELGEEEVMVVVVPRAGTEVDAAELVAFCEERIAAFMVPRFVRVVPDLPKTPTEKVQKFELRRVGTAGAWDRATPAWRRLS